MGCGELVSGNEMAGTAGRPLCYPAGMLGIAEEWEGGIEEFVEEANRHLAELLPMDRSARPKDEVNARLVRHYTTEGLLPLPRREGREARYARLHLLSLLALRRLMADGLSGKALIAALNARSEEELAHLAQEGNLGLEGRAFASSHLSVPTSALAYVQHLMAGTSSSSPATFSVRPVDASPLFSSAPCSCDLAAPEGRVKAGDAGAGGPRPDAGNRRNVPAPRNERERQALLDALWASLVDAGQVEP